jgi:hypothetical protein
MTGCPSCARAEMSRWQRFTSDAASVLSGPSYAELVSAAFAPFATPWEERHRREYARTGDPQELVRMERHIRLEG